MENIVSTLSQYISPALASIIGAALALLVGWIIAYIVSRVVSGILKRVQLDKRVAGAQDVKEGAGYPVERWIGTAVFWFIFLFFVVGALALLGFTRVSEAISAPLQTIVSWLPLLFAAGILALIAHIVGTVLRRLVVGLLQRRQVDEKLASSAGTRSSIATPLGDAVYYLVWLLFLPAILGALGMESLLVPVVNLINELLGFVPLLVSAGIILLVGWFVARIVQRIVTGFLASVGVDSFAERVGIAKYMGGMTVSYLLGLIVFIVILIPIITASLDALGLQSLTAPLTAMMTEVISNLPNYVMAVAILIVTYVVARWILGILAEILTGLGVNSIPRVLGLSDRPTIGTRTVAQWICEVLLVIVMLLAAVQAAQVVGWTAVTVAIGGLGTQFVQIIFGLIIIAVGVYLANLAAQFINGTTVPNKSLLALVARVAIIGFAGAMGLTAMGFATQIVVLAFGLFFGAIAIAVALAFGLGGRETAGKYWQEWSDGIRKQSAEKPALPSASSGSTDAPKM
ncbi:MAG: hypothetical protein EYC68_08240 [Chloroflexota bacterium]|nr:MAG: hypothetical protein EYC68_08240 [Chloroflexota bacterium]